MCSLHSIIIHFHFNTPNNTHNHNQYNIYINIQSDADTCQHTYTPDSKFEMMCSMQLLYMCNYVVSKIQCTFEYVMVQHTEKQCNMRSLVLHTRNFRSTTRVCVCMIVYAIVRTHSHYAKLCMWWQTLMNPDINVNLCNWKPPKPDAYWLLTETRICVNNANSNTFTR